MCAVQLWTESPRESKSSRGGGGIAMCQHCSDSGSLRQEGWKVMRAFFTAWHPIHLKPLPPPRHTEMGGSSIYIYGGLWRVVRVLDKRGQHWGLGAKQGEGEQTKSQFSYRGSPSVHRHTLFPTKTGKPDANSLNNTVQQLCIGLFSQSKSVCIA